MKKCIPLLFVFLLVSCATTRTASLLDRDYKNYTVESLIVEFKNLSFQETLDAEELISKKLAKYDVDVRTYSSLIPPTKKYTDEKITTIIAESKICTLLLIDVSKGTEEEYIPETRTKRSRDKSYYTDSNGKLVVKESYTPETVTGGYTKITAKTTTTAQLIDLEKGNIIWMGEVNARNKNTSSYDSLIKTTINDVIKELKNKNLIK